MSTDCVQDEVNMDKPKATNDVNPPQQQELLHRYHTSQSVIIPREVFESLYLEPTAIKKGSRLGTMFGNPTPMYVTHPAVGPGTLPRSLRMQCDVDSDHNS